MTLKRVSHGCMHRRITQTYRNNTIVMWEQAVCAEAHSQCSTLLIKIYIGNITQMLHIIGHVSLYITNHISLPQTN